MKRNFREFLMNSLSNFGALMLAIGFYFAILRFGMIWNGLRGLMNIMTPFVYGGVMAYLLKTPCNFFLEFYEKKLPEKRKKSAGALSILTVFAITILVIYVLLSMVIPQLISSITRMSIMMPGRVVLFEQWLEKVLADNAVVQNYVVTMVEALEDKVIAWATTDLVPLMQSMMGELTGYVSGVFGFLKDMLIGTIVCIYLLAERKTFARQGKLLLKSVFGSRGSKVVLDEFVFIDETFEGFFGGKILDSAIVGLICYVVLFVLSLITGFRNAALISVIVGLTNIIPYFGPFIGAIPSAILILMESPSDCVIFLIFVVILQQLDGNVIGPRILAGRVGLSGFWVLFSITLFSGVFGFVGILVGVPVFAVIYDLIRRGVRRGLAYYENKEKTEIAHEPEKDSEE